MPNRAPLIILLGIAAAAALAYAFLQTHARSPQLLTFNPGMTRRVANGRASVSFRTVEPAMVVASPESVIGAGVEVRCKEETRTLTVTDVSTPETCGVRLRLAGVSGADKDTAAVKLEISWR